LPVHNAIYGLKLKSNLQIPGLLVCPDFSEPDVCVHLNENSGIIPASSRDIPIFYSSPFLNKGQPLVRVGKLDCGTFVFLYADGVRFGVENTGRHVWADWPEGYALSDAATYLVGPIIGFVLRLRGVVPLHASSIVIGDRAIAVMGESGAGKSTTSAAFAKLGYAILAEDVAALTDCGSDFLIQPGYPRVNLWPDSVQALFGAHDALPLMTPTWEKRFLPLDEGTGRFQKHPLPLAAIFLLGRRVPHSPDFGIKKIHPASALIQVVTHSYVNYILDHEMRRKEFAVLAKLVGQVPVYEVHPIADPQRVYDLCEAIAAVVANESLAHLESDLVGVS
jgi:hypothetical protein